jgi:hypothetical protein
MARKMLQVPSCPQGWESKGVIKSGYNFDLRPGGMAQAIEHLSCNREALSSKLHYCQKIRYKK